MRVPGVRRQGGPGRKATARRACESRLQLVGAALDVVWPATPDLCSSLLPSQVLDGRLQRSVCGRGGSPTAHQRNIIQAASSTYGVPYGARARMILLYL